MKVDETEMKAIAMEMTPRRARTRFETGAELIDGHIRRQGLIVPVTFSIYRDGRITLTIEGKVIDVPEEASEAIKQVIAFNAATQGRPLRKKYR